MDDCASLDLRIWLLLQQFFTERDQIFASIFTVSYYNGLGTNSGIS